MNGRASAKGDMRMSGDKDGEQRKGSDDGLMNSDSHLTRTRDRPPCM